MALIKNYLLALFFVTILAGNPANAQATKAPAVPSLNKVIWIWLENTPYELMMNQSYVKQIFWSYPSVKFDHFQTTSSSTQGNALSMIAGTDFGVKDNDLTRVSGASLVDLLEAKNIPWRVYAEEFPGACFLNAGGGDYKRYRVPFLSLDKVEADRYLCMKIVGFKNLEEDIKNDSLPAFTVIIPNLKNSGATTDVATADETLRRVLAPVLYNADAILQTTVIVSTINNTDVENPGLFTMILGNGVQFIGSTISTPYNHYHLLRTIEEGLQLGNLHQNDAHVDPMVGFWNP